VSALSLSNVHVTIDGAHILKGVDLQVERGEWVNVIGPNGAGKTTLLRAISGAVPADGSIDIDDGAAPTRGTLGRKVAIVPQSPTIPPGVTVTDYVLLGRTPHRGPFAGDSPHDLDIASDALRRLDLVGFATRTVASLSGGERQRVVLARALVQEADLLLLDEPTTALDLGHQQDVLELVDGLRRNAGLTIVATLHDLTLAGRYGERIVLLDGGEVVANGVPSDVLTEATISEHFGATVRVLDDGEGPVILPTVRR
jgi:iron complex transport system ATP-binding protein